MSVPVLVMPGGERGGGEQGLVVDTIKQLHKLQLDIFGESRWAVQAVMPKTDPPMRFIRDWPDWFTPGWRWKMRPSELIQWFVDRRNRQIGEAIGVAGFEPVFTVTDYECQDTTDPELYDAAVAKVTRLLDTDGLYGSGTPRFRKEFDPPLRLERLQDAMGSTVLFPSAYHKFNYKGGREPLPVDDTIEWARERGTDGEVWPYLSGAFGVDNGSGPLVPPTLLRDGIRRMVDAGAKGFVAWVGMNNPYAVRDVRHLLEVVRGIN